MTLGTVTTYGADLPLTHAEIFISPKTGPAKMTNQKEEVRTVAIVQGLLSISERSYPPPNSAGKFKRNSAQSDERRWFCLHDRLPVLVSLRRRL